MIRVLLHDCIDLTLDQDGWLGLAQWTAVSRQRLQVVIVTKIASLRQHVNAGNSIWLPFHNTHATE